MFFFCFLLFHSVGIEVRATCFYMCLGSVFGVKPENLVVSASFFGFRTEWKSTVSQVSQGCISLYWESREKLEGEAVKPALVSFYEEAEALCVGGLMPIAIK